MNFIEMQKTELEKMQVEECLERMKNLDFRPNVIAEFMNKGTLYRSEYGFLYWLTDEEKNMIYQWQGETGNIVYHVIKSVHEFGTSYSFLYVSNYVDEWKYEREDLKQYMPIVYVKNIGNDYFSEYGTIRVRPVFGGLVRIA